MTGLVAVCASGRFVSRYTFATILVVSVVALAPTPDPMHPGLRILIAATTASLFGCEWGAVALAERAIRRRAVRGAVVLATLAVSSLTRPTVQDAVSVALGAPVPPPGAELLRAATNLVVWTLALGGTALLVDAARTTRRTNTLLRTVLAQLQSSAVRARRFTVEARAATMRATALIREPFEATSEGARLRAATLRTAAHELHALADRSAASSERLEVVDSPSARALLRLPPVGALTASYVVAVLPYALRTVDPVALPFGIAVTLVCGLAAELAPRRARWRRSVRRRLRVFVVSIVAAGVVLGVIAGLQGVPWPVAALPVIVFPALGMAAARWRGGEHALAVERRRLSAAITARTRADDRDTRSSRAGLRAAADILHRDAQGALVLFALRCPEPSPADRAELSDVLEHLACAVVTASEAPVTGADSRALDALVATWALAMRVEVAIDGDARLLLDADPALADDTIDIVAEGLLNAAKHARHRAAIVTVRVCATGAGPRLRVEVRSPGAAAAPAALRAGSRIALRGARLVAEPDTTVLIADLPPGPGIVVPTEHRSRAAVDPA